MIGSNGQEGQSPRILRDYPFTAVLIALALGCVSTLVVIEAVRVTPETEPVAVPAPTPPTRKPRNDAPIEIKPADVIAAFASVPSRKVIVDDVKWFDLIGDGDARDFSATFRRYESDDCSLGIYSLRGGEPRMLFHQREYLPFADVATFDGRPYLILWTLSGSGRFLTFDVLSWDGAGPLDREFAVESSDGDPGIFWAGMNFIDGKVFVNGGGGWKQLVRRDGRFELAPWRVHPTHAELGPKRHVLRVRCRGDGYLFTLDGEPLRVEKTGEGACILKPPLTLRMDESLLVDHNVDDWDGLSTWFDGDADWQGMLLPFLVPAAPGTVQLNVEVKYSDRYTLHVTFREPATEPTPRAKGE